MFNLAFLFPRVKRFDVEENSLVRGAAQLDLGLQRVLLLTRRGPAAKTQHFSIFQRGGIELHHGRNRTRETCHCTIQRKDPSLHICRLESNCTTFKWFR